MTTVLENLGLRAALLADSRARLAVMVTALKTAMQALSDNNMPAIRIQASLASEAWAALEEGIQAAPHHFIKPRTVTMHDIKFGLQATRPGVEVPDAEKTVKLIKKHLPEKAELLIDVKETPSKTALAELTPAELRKIGCKVLPAGDQVVIKPADTTTDKLVKALIKAAVDDERGTDTKTEPD